MLMLRFVFVLLYKNLICKFEVPKWNQHTANRLSVFFFKIILVFIFSGELVEIASSWKLSAAIPFLCLMNVWKHASQMERHTVECERDGLSILHVKLPAIGIHRGIWFYRKSCFALAKVTMEHPLMFLHLVIHSIGFQFACLTYQASETIYFTRGENTGSSAFRKPGHGRWKQWQRRTVLFAINLRTHTGWFPLLNWEAIWFGRQKQFWDWRALLSYWICYLCRLVNEDDIGIW